MEERKAFPLAAGGPGGCDMKRKLLEFGGALLMMGGILAIMLLLLGNVGNEPPEVGTAQMKAAGKTITPVCLETYETVGGVKTEKPVETPEAAALPEIDYDDSLTASYDGKSLNGPFYFTFFHEDMTVASDKKAFFEKPEEAGVYVVKIETYWGSEKDNIGVEYYFRLNIR